MCSLFCVLNSERGLTNCVINFNEMGSTFDHVIHTYCNIILPICYYCCSTTCTSSRVLQSLDDSFGAQNHAIAEFRNFASAKNIHVTIVIHPRKENVDQQLTNASVFGTAKATQEADNVYILQSQPQKEKVLQVSNIIIFIS